MAHKRNEIFHIGARQDRHAVLPRPVAHLRIDRPRGQKQAHWGPCFCSMASRRIVLMRV